MRTSLSPRTRTDDVTDVLRTEVLRGQYRPGERLPSERDLAVRFKTTRGVVRVALKRLEQLGIADVQPGGARVVAVHEASLDVVGHLLDLESPPQPELVEQVLEVGGALMAAAARIAVERGSSADLLRARALLDRMRAADVPDGEQLELVQELSHVFLDASDNLVLNIIRRALHTQVFDRLHEAPWRPEPELGHVRSVAERLARALDARDPMQANEEVLALWRGVRERVLCALREARAVAGASAREASPGVAAR